MCFILREMQACLFMNSELSTNGKKIKLKVAIRLILKNMLEIEVLRCLKGPSISLGTQINKQTGKYT